MAGLRVYLTADGGSVAAARDGVVVVDGRLARARDHWELQITAPVPRGDELDDEAIVGVVRHLLELAARAAPMPARWVVSEPTVTHDRIADEVGLIARRDVLQVRRPLPVEAGPREGVPAITARPFRVGVDEEAWLAVNNRSFADHPDQSARTRADIEEQEAEPWFDPDGFLLLDRDPDDAAAGLDGFCWTKVHAALDPPLGEIYVIGVDPSATGRRLGPALTLAGLDHLSGRGLLHGMLYVDALNTTARKMYDRLGFELHHIDRVYAAP